MGAIDLPTHELIHRKSFEERADLDAPEVCPEVDALLEKIHQLTKMNERLRELVTQLSVLVIKNIVDWESGLKQRARRGEGTISTSRGRRMRGSRFKGQLRKPNPGLLDVSRGSVRLVG